MKRLLERSGLAAALVLVSLPASSHHSMARFDFQRDVTLTGVVTKFLWANPHVYIDVRTGNDEDASSTWSIEGPSPHVLSKSGWSTTSLAQGDRVVVIGSPARDPKVKAAAGDSVLKADGTLLNVPHLSGLGALTAAPRTPFVAADLSGHWLQTWDMPLVARFAQLPLALPLTDRGAAAVASYDPDSDSPSNDCVGESVPYTMLFPDMVSIELGEDTTVIHQEDQLERIVHMNLDSHDGAQFSQRGHSIGRWQDGVLVVDTTHFADHRIGNAIGLPSGSEKHLVERFALSSDKTRLSYTFRLEDPEYLAEPVTATVMMTYRPDLPFVDLPCDSESARRYLVGKNDF
jgi:Family of unknown function (DUF6152)